MTKKEFKEIMKNEDFDYAVECLSDECRYIVQNGYMGEFIRTDWHDIYGYPIDTEKDTIRTYEDIEDFLDDDDE